MQATINTNVAQWERDWYKQVLGNDDGVGVGLETPLFDGDYVTFRAPDGGSGILTSEIISTVDGSLHRNPKLWVIVWYDGTPIAVEAGDLLSRETPDEYDARIEAEEAAAAAECESSAYKLGLL